MTFDLSVVPIQIPPAFCDGLAEIGRQSLGRQAAESVGFSEKLYVDKLGELIGIARNLNVLLSKL